jgi:sulfite oxidase
MFLPDRVWRLALTATEKPPEFQLHRLPPTNPLLRGKRWKEYHEVLGNPLRTLPARSWAAVVEEKAPDMIHVLSFPYNGETPPVSMTARHPPTPSWLADYLRRLC